MRTGYYFLLAVLAAAVCSAAVLFALRSSLRQFFIDRPDSRKIHQSPIPRMGGLCIIAASMIVLTFWNKFFPHAGLGFLGFLPLPLYYAVVLSALGLFFLGFFDDSSFAKVRVRHKLGTEFALACLVVILFRISSSHVVMFSVPIPSWIVVPVAILWLVGLMNAFNIIDGVDGLAGGIAVIAFIALSIFAAQLHAMAVVGLCLILAGATLGFLAFNVSPARIFLGDTGSLFLGSMLGTLTLYCATISHRPFSRPVLFLIVAVPVIDVFVAIVRRYLKAQDKGLGLRRRLNAIIIADNNHIHHRLIMRGFSHSQTSLILYSFSAFLCFGGLLAWYVPLPLKIAILAYLGLCIVLFLARLGFGGRFRKFLKVELSSSRKDAQKTSPAHEQAQPIGIIDPKGLIFRCLRKFRQNDFVFVNLTKENWQACVSGLSAMVIRSLPASVLADDLKVGQEIAVKHNCPVIVVSEKAGLELTVSVPSSAPICYRKMPVSVPKIMEDLKGIKRDVTSIPLPLSPIRERGEYLSNRKGRLPLGQTGEVS